jgi:betaine lipid synthase
MLGLVAAQLKHKVESKEIKAGKAVWVDVSFLTLSNARGHTD